MSESKHCRGCGNTLPATAEFFPRRAKSKDGLGSRCKPCVSESHKDYKALKRVEGINFTDERDYMHGLVLACVSVMNERNQKRAAAIRRREYEGAMR